MKLLRLKITDPKCFRSLQAGFEYQFRTEWDLQEEKSFAPFVCAGPNGSGKSNLLEALAAIFYHLECMYLENRPDSFDYDEDINPDGFRGDRATPDGYEIEYVIPVKDGSELAYSGIGGNAHIKIIKNAEQSPVWYLVGNSSEQELVMTRKMAQQLLPDYILGYSSGENEILSLPFFKMRFVQFDEYDQVLKQQLPYPGRPESRLVYLDSSFSQAILLCNLLFQDADALTPFRDDVKIAELREFRIIIQRSIELEESQIPAFGSQDENKKETVEETVKNHPALSTTEDESRGKRYRVNLAHLLDGSDASDKIIPRLKRCATCWYHDESSDTLYLDYFVNEATRQVFRDNFSNDPIELFQAFQVLLTLNLYTASYRLKAELYQSESLYVNETVPILASDERIMRFKHFWVKKTDSTKPALLKSLSDGEHQLLHALGLCLLFRNTQSLFLLDEPETHFNPDWRANFITRLSECFKDSEGQEMLITTHAPFLLSDSKPEKVLVFNKSDDVVSVTRPEYNTLGASVNKITMATFGKRETIGLRAQTMLKKIEQRFAGGEDKEQLLAEIDSQLGDSVEKILLIKTILGMEDKG